MAMLLNYLRTALRNIRRHRVHSLLNIVGLSIGMACAIIIVQWVRFEFSYDRYHTNADRIYRLATDFNFGTFQDRAATSAHPVGPTLQRDFDEVERAVRFRNSWGESIVTVGTRSLAETRMYFADHTVFQIFSFSLIHGDPDTALIEPYSIVLTRDAALKYFGTTDVVGKHMQFSNLRFPALRHGPQVTVTGVMENVPPNSHLKFSMLLSFETFYRGNENQRHRWTGDIDNYTYLLLAPNCDAEALAKKFPHLVQTHLEQGLVEAEAGYDLFLQPLTRIHLHSNLVGEVGAANHLYKVIALLVTAILILMIASINFINLSNARLAGRAREVGIRKALGADRKALIFQFMGESILISVMALLLALGSVELLKPIFTLVDGLQIHYAGIYQPVTLAGYLLLAIGIGAVSGSYPAAFFAAAQPGSFLGRRAAVRGGRFRSLLVVIQFSISIGLIIVSIVIYRQFDHMLHKELGFDKEQVLVVKMVNPEIRKTYQSVRKKLMVHEGVSGVTFTSYQPGRHARINVFAPEGYTPKEMQRMDAISIDEAFIPIMGIKLAGGRNFASDREDENRSAALVNISAARDFGWSDAIGKTITELTENATTKTIIGVTEDFHQRNLFIRILPLYIEYAPEKFNFVLIKLKTGSRQAAIDFIEAKWKEINRSKAFVAWFLDDGQEEHYRSLRQMGNLFVVFTLVALLIACLGLYGLTAFTVEARTREIGIRKSIGAGRADIFRLLIREFVKWVLIANIIAWPLVYWFNEHWLREFPYRVKMNLGIFISAGLAALIIALATVSWKARNAARANPIDAIRYE